MKNQFSVSTIFLRLSKTEFATIQFLENRIHLQSKLNTQKPELTIAPFLSCYRLVRKTKICVTKGVKILSISYQSFSTASGSKIK